jgi:hypothetical protein
MPHDDARGPETPRDLLTYFDEEHRRRTGFPAVIVRGKDARILASLTKSHGADVVQDLIFLFFETRDKFILEAGFSVGVFQSQAAKLLLELQRRYRKGRS